MNSYYVFTGRVTVFFLFANNSNGMSDQAVNFTQFFLDPEVIFSSHITFINLTYTDRRLSLVTVTSKSNTCVSLIIMVPTLLHFCNRYEIKL